MPASRAASASTSPSTFALGNVSARPAAVALILRASPVPAASRSSSNAISVLRSSKRRPKWVNAASVSPACQDPMIRSPAALISQTVPSSSTRPNRWGSLAGAEATRVRVGAGRWFGPGPRSRPRGGPGLVVWLVRRHELPLPTLRAVTGRASAAHCGAVDTRCFGQHLTSIEAACSLKWPELAAQAMALATNTPHS